MTDKGIVERRACGVSKSVRSLQQELRPSFFYLGGGVGGGGGVCVCVPPGWSNAGWHAMMQGGIGQGAARAQQHWAGLH